MQRKRIYILSILLSLTLSVFSQGYVQVTKNHEEYIMQQFTTMETGAGALTPRFYYNAFHKKYQRTANVENKQLFRIHMKARVADEKVYADSIDSVTMRRAKIEGKLSIFQSNINNIMPYGGTSEDYRQWKNIYNCIQTAIKVTRESYQDSGKKKREYLAIYKDIVGRNYHLTQLLLTWNSIKRAKDMQKNSKPPQRLTSIRTTAFDAMNRWKAAMAVDGFSPGGKRK